MKKFLNFKVLTFAVLIDLLMGFQAATAAVKKPIPPRASNSSVAPLSVSECLALGGQVRFSESIWCLNTGHSCWVVDSDGVIHVACIDKIE